MLSRSERITPTHDRFEVQCFLKSFILRPKKEAAVQSPAVSRKSPGLAKGHAALVRSLVSAKTRRPFSASSIISRTAEVSGLTSMRSQAPKCRKMPSVAMSKAVPMSFE
jgi:hypothetical protein